MARVHPARTRELVTLAEEARRCTRCPLYTDATQTVFGEGDVRSPIVLVGEQPGDQEDRQGHPFVGPAGHLLDALLEEAGVARTDCYLTNAVKHFKWEPRGKRRIHKKPTDREADACMPWLEAELAVVRPRVLVALGATAARALFGRGFRLLANLGTPVETRWAPHALATYHPSALLRMPGEGNRAEARAKVVAHVAAAARLAADVTMATSA